MEGRSAVQIRMLLNIRPSIFRQCQPDVVAARAQGIVKQRNGVINRHCSPTARRLCDRLIGVAREGENRTKRFATAMIDRRFSIFPFSSRNRSAG